MNIRHPVSRFSFQPLLDLWSNRGTHLVQTFALAAVAISLAGAADAATATFNITAPTLGANDQSSLVASGTAGQNVGGGDGHYIADDQVVPGQTFKTGSNANGYQLTAVTLQHVAYSTFVLVPDITYTIRITIPATNTLTVLAEETAFVPEDSSDCDTCNFATFNGGNTSTTGSGRYITFTLAVPVVLSPNTTYGFDVGGGGVRHYYEIAGKSAGSPPTNPYPNGNAYSTGTGGFGSTTMTNRIGDRVFVARLTALVSPVAPSITVQPKPVALYAGGQARFSGKATGSPVVGYQWRKNGTNITNGGNISGVLTDTLTISNIAQADAGAYTLVATNAVGAVTSAPPATLTVVAAPAAGNNYTYAVITNNPIAYWRLNESDDPSTNPPAFDYSGGRIGTYETASQNGIAGPRPSAFPGFESTNTAMQATADTDLAWVTVPGLDLNTNTVTLTAWIYPNGVQPADAGLFWTRSGTTAGLGFGGPFAGTTDQLVYTWNNGTTWTFVSGLVIPSDQWSFVAVAIEATKATLYLGAGGSLSNSINAIPHISEAWAGPARIGSDPHGSSPARNFNGIIDEVAVFKRSLSFDDLNRLYGIGRGSVQLLPPVVGTQPQAQSLYAGRTARFSASVSGSAPLVYHWRRNGTNISDGGNISGALTDSLTVTNVAGSDAGAYTLVVTNSVGAATSSPPATLTVVAPSGKAYESAVRAANPVAYWRLNETGDPSGGTLPAFNHMGGVNGTYGAVSQPGVVGPRPTDFPELESTNTGVQTTANGGTPSWVTLPALNLNTDTVTITAWIHPNAEHSGFNGLLMTRNGSTVAAGLHYTSDNQLGYTWNGGSPDTYTFVSELRPPVGQWSFVALVINPSNAALYLYNNTGLSSTNNAIPHTSEAWDGNAQLGGDQETPNNRIFDGRIDEVAVFNYAFTPAQVLNFYNAAFNAAPPSVTLAMQRVGANVQLSWPQGTLLESGEVTGPWTTNGAPSPYVFAPNGAKKFFRLRVQ